MHPPVSAVPFLDLSRDLADRIEGPSDLSTNKAHYEGYGKRDLGDHSAIMTDNL